MDFCKALRLHDTQNNDKGVNRNYIYTNLSKSIYINVKGLIVGLNIAAYSFTECTPYVM